MVPLGFSMMPPAGTYGRLAPRSGLALKNGLHVLAGVIDPDYTGLVSVILLNTDYQAYRVTHHDRVCQMILEYACVAEIEEVSILTLTDRASGGFGSTGV
jgi:dUTP pyrophosphatase